MLSIVRSAQTGSKVKVGKADNGVRVWERCVSWWEGCELVGRHGWMDGDMRGGYAYSFNLWV